MEEEIIKFITAWLSILISASYCYGISKLVPKAGTIRFLLFLPVICLFCFLPSTLNSVNSIVPTAFFATWLTTFKLLLLVSGTGPLSDPSLSLFHFLIIACFPIKLQKKNVHYNTQKIDLGISYFHELIKMFLISLFSIILILGPYNDKLPRKIYLFFLAAYIYTTLEVVLGVAAFTAQLLLGTDHHVDVPFLKPYRSTSLQDFWGRRWNRVASSSLRSTVFDPILHSTSQVLGRKWAAALALLVTFGVSYLMHEIIFYYLGRARLGWGTLLFFVFQGFCIVIESIVKRKIDAKWQLPQIIMGPLVFGFAVCTFIWLSIRELMLEQNNIVDRTLQDNAAMGLFVKDLALSWSKLVYNVVL